MCDGTSILNKLKDRQVNVGEVRCTCSIKCWCNKLSFRFPVDQEFDECMSPMEMLEMYRSQMDKDDINYLKSLSSKTFIS